MKPPKKPTGAELRALREQRELANPKHEAERREASFLANLSRAQDDFDWITSNEAWKLLGHETFSAWWGEKVRPIMRGLSMRPSRELAEVAADLIRAEEAELPPAMRRRERELAEHIGVGRDELRDRPARSSSGGNTPNDDLAVDPLDQIPAEAQQAIEDRINQQASGSVGTSPADGTGENTPVDPPSTPDASEDTDRAGEGQSEDDRSADDSLSEAGIGSPAADGAGTPTAPADPEVSAPEPSGSADPERASDEHFQHLTGLAQSPCEVRLVHEAHNHRVADERGMLYAFECPGVVAPDPRALLKDVAEKFEDLDLGNLGPTLTSAELDGMRDSLDRIAAVIELLSRWHERAHA